MGFILGSTARCPAQMPRPWFSIGGGEDALKCRLFLGYKNVLLLRFSFYIGSLNFPEYMFFYCCIFFWVLDPDLNTLLLIRNFNPDPDPIFQVVPDPYL